MPAPKHITLDDLCIESGAGPIKARRLVRERKLPGFIDGNTYICSPGEFQDWLDGNWEYRGIPSTPPRDRSESASVSFLHTVNSKGVA